MAKPCPWLSLPLLYLVVDIWLSPVSYTHLDVYKRQMLYLIEKSLELVDDPFIPFSISSYVDFLSSTLKGLQKECSNSVSFDEVFSGMALWEKTKQQFEKWKGQWTDLMYGNGIYICLLYTSRCV